MSQVEYLGNVGPWVAPGASHWPRLHALVLFAEALDNLAPEFATSFWEDFCETARSDQDPLEDLIAWLGRFGLAKWERGHDSEEPTAFDWFSFPLLGAVFTVTHKEVVPAEQLGLTHREVMAECRRQRVLGPGFDLYYGKKRLADTIEYLSAHGGSINPLARIEEAGKKVPPYNPLLESEKDYLSRIKDYVGNVNRMAAAEGAKKAKRLNNPDRDFEWLVRCVVLKERVPDIALGYDEERELGTRELSDAFNAQNPGLLALVAEGRDLTGGDVGVTSTSERVQKALERRAGLIGLKLPWDD